MSMTPEALRVSWCVTGAAGVSVFGVIQVKWRMRPTLSLVPSKEGEPWTFRESEPHSRLPGRDGFASLILTI